MTPNAPLVVSIGTTHPRNVAGVGLDAQIAVRYGIVHHMVIAAVSAQDEHGVQSLVALPPDSVRAQLETVAVDRAAAVRIGALGSADNASAVCDALDRVIVPIVFDPVARASAGGWLYQSEADAKEALFEVMRRLRPILTPNIGEAVSLSGTEIFDHDSTLSAATRLLDQGAGAVLIKGGHMSGDPVDVLVTRDKVERFFSHRIPGTFRGTGCRLAMALACEIALGRDLVSAVKGARGYVHENLARS